MPCLALGTAMKWHLESWRLYTPTSCSTGLEELNLDMNPLHWEDPYPQPPPGPGGFGGGPGGGHDGPGGGPPFDFAPWYPGPRRSNARPATGAGQQRNYADHGIRHLFDELDFAMAVDPPQEPNMGPAAQGGFAVPMTVHAGGVNNQRTALAPIVRIWPVQGSVFHCL